MAATPRDGTFVIRAPVLATAVQSMVIGSHEESMAARSFNQQRFQGIVGPNSQLDLPVQVNFVVARVAG